MKKNMIKLMAALLAALILAAPVMALAEDEGAEPAPAPVVKEEVKKEAPKAEAPKAEESKPAETKAEAPKAEESKPAEAKADAEAPKAEESKPTEEAPKAEESKPAEEAPKAEEPKAEETEQPAESVEPAETEEPAETSKPEAAPEKFTGHVEVKRVGSSELHYGDKVTLKAIVTKANVKYSIRWEAKINGEWKKLATGEKYEFIVKKENAELSYRAVAVADSKANEKESDIFKLPEVTEAPAEEEPVEEQPAEEPVAEEPTTEEPVVEEPVAEEPVTEEPAEEIPAEEIPAEEIPTEEIPAEEIPAEELPAEEEPVEELPAEELPLDETTSEEEIDEEALVEIPEVVDTPLGAAPVISQADADVRVAADGLSDIFVTLPEGTVLNVLSIEGDWVLVEIEVDGLVMQGYIHKKDVLGLPEEEPEVDEAGEVVEIPKKVTIFSSRRTVMTRGETVELTSLLEGFEDCSEILYQWECDNGSGFVAVPGANSASYSFKASAMTLSWGWRLTVNYR